MECSSLDLNRFLLVVSLIYNNVYILIPNSHFPSLPSVESLGRESTAAPSHTVKLGHAFQVTAKYSIRFSLGQWLGLFGAVKVKVVVPSGVWFFLQSRGLEPSRQEDCGGQPSPSPGDLPHPGIEPEPFTLQVDSLVWDSRDAYKALRLDFWK